jgi:G3E family GTPase
LALADSIIITKADLLEPGQRMAREGEARSFLASINPSADLLDRHDDWPDIRSMLLAGGTYDLRSKGEDVRAWLRAEEVLAAAGAEPGHTAPHRHSQDIRSHCIVIDCPMRPFRFRFFLDALRMSAGPDLLRAKGLVGLTDDVDRPIVLHGVQHIIDTSTRLDAWPGGDRRTRIVLIGRKLNVSAMRVILEPEQAPKSPTKRATSGMLHRAIEATSVFLPRPASRPAAIQRDVEPHTAKRNAARSEQ